MLTNLTFSRLDTPGVIQRVSTLFQGHEQFILGFNAFLPEGYKIDLKNTNFERQQHLHANAQQNQLLLVSTPSVGSQLIRTHEIQPGSASDQSLVGRTKAILSEKTEDEARNNGRPVELDHAINFVITIKNRFSNDRTTYRTFLDILYTIQKDKNAFDESLNQVRMKMWGTFRNVSVSFFLENTSLTHFH